MSKKSLQKKKIQPQLKLDSCPPQNNWSKHPNGYTKINHSTYQCNLCAKQYSKANAIQQHCKQHFPPQYHCKICGDEWYIKTGYLGHFLVECNLCHKMIKKTSQSGHMRSCPMLKT